MCSPSLHSPGTLWTFLTRVCLACARASVERDRMETNRLRRPWGPRARKGPRPLSSLSRQAPVFRMEWSPVPGTGGNAALWRRFTPAVPGFPSAANSGWRFDACASGKVGNHHPQGSKKELFDLLFPQPGPREACGTLKLGGGRRGGKVQEALDPEDFCSPSPSLFRGR